MDSQESDDRRISKTRAKAKKVKQACDSCRARKIRCDGACPCSNCVTTSLQCTFLAVHKKTGPKGGRRRRRHALPCASQDGDTSPGSSTPLTDSFQHDVVDSPASGPPDLPVADVLYIGDNFGFQPSPALTVDVVSLCMSAFFKHKYPITPILAQDQMQTALLYYESSPELYGLLAACCAVMVLSPGILKQTSSSPSAQSLLMSSLLLPPSSPSPSATLDGLAGMPPARSLVSEALRARRFSTYTENPSLITIQTSFFLFSAYFCLGEDTSAWFYLREAITLLQLLRFHEESSYVALSANDPLSAVYARRIFWVLFITERAYALQRNRVLTLQPTIELPSVESDSEAPILRGFLNLISLFQHFDEEFVGLWNQSSRSSPSEKPLVKLQNILAYSMPAVSGCTQGQLADLLVSREWLKTIVWQLCVSKSMLSSSSREESLSFRYPVAIARDVVLISRLLPLEAFEANGVGILEKMFDIGCSLSDVLSLEPGSAPPSTLEVGPRDCLVELVHIIGSFGGGFKNLQILARKAADCLRTSVERPLPAVQNDDDCRQIYEL